MKKELSIKQIYDDFVSKVILSDVEKEILIRYIKDETIIKISSEISQSTSTISRIISEINN